MSHSMQRLSVATSSALDIRVERQISKVVPCVHLTTATRTNGHAHAVHLCYGTRPLRYYRALTLSYKYCAVHLQ